MTENLSRRLALKLLTAALAAPTFSMLKMHTAYAETKIDCPIYMFHQTGAAAVEQILRSNMNAGRAPISVGDLGRVLRGEIDVPDRPPFVLTFDDGYKIQYDQAAPVLDKHEATATFFVMGTGWPGDGVHTYMTANQIADLSKRGYEIGSHTINHVPDLVKLRANNFGEYQQELLTSKVQLEEITGSSIDTFAYPYGVFDNVVAKDVATIYQAAVSTIPGRVQAESILDRLLRTRVN